MDGEPIIFTGLYVPDSLVVHDLPGLREPPQENDPLAEKWHRRLEDAKRHYKRWHRRIRYNRKLVQGVDRKAEPESPEYNKLRANLIQGTVTAMLPNIYAKNPEISVSATHSAEELKLFCRTVEKVVNRYLERADLKSRGKSAVRACMTCGIGALKVTWQQDIRRDPVIEQRIQDAQDNVVQVERLLMELNDPQARKPHEEVKAELEQTLAALRDKVEVVAGEGIAIDHVLTENLLVDPAVQEFWDYRNADWIAQVCPMRKADAEALYGFRLDGVSRFSDDPEEYSRRMREQGMRQQTEEDTQVLVYEIWDRATQRVYTLAEGCRWWLREPFSPEAVGERWFPFFLLPYQTVDGTFAGPSLVDLLEKLQVEHNETRDKFNEHRKLVKPGYIASADVAPRTVNRFVDAVMGEVTVLEGVANMPLNQLIVPKQHPPVDAAVYDTSGVRYDWEQVSGLQDAARSTVVQPKTATEASIMQQSLSGRVAEFRDQVEDFMQDLAQYTAQVLLLTVGEEQVARIMGPNVTSVSVDPATGLPSVEVVSRNYDWRRLSREEAFSLLDVRIRAGSTGAPDKQEEQENWLKMLQVVQPLQQTVIQMQAQGLDASVFINLIKETINRFDDGLDLDDFIPKPPVLQAAAAQALPAQGVPQPVPQQP